MSLCIPDAAGMVMAWAINLGDAFSHGWRQGGAPLLTPASPAVGTRVCLGGVVASPRAGVWADLGQGCSGQAGPWADVAGKLRVWADRRWLLTAFSLQLG